MALEAREPLPDLVYSFFDDLDDDPEFALNLAPQKFAAEEIQNRQGQMRRRLDSRTRGLLELENDQFAANVDSVHVYRVVFLHRTVRDFLSDGNIQVLLQTDGDGNPLLAACHTFLAQLKTAIAQVAQKPLEELLCFASLCSAGPDSYAELELVIDAAEDLYKIYYRRKYHRWLFVGLAAKADFYLYVKAKLDSRPHGTMLSAVTGFDPPLYYALNIGRKARYDNLSLRCIALLLEAGADPSEQLVGGPLWEDFLSTIHSGNRTTRRERRHLYEIVEMLLAYGADWNAKLLVSNSDVTLSRMSAVDILKKFLGKSELAQLHEISERRGRKHHAKQNNNAQKNRKEIKRGVRAGCHQM
ncbi:hypothetical protein AB5N19_03047 [Seiridium cardinale]